MKVKENDSLEFKREVKYLFHGYEYETQRCLIKNFAELHSFISQFHIRTQNILLELEIFSKEDLRLAFKNDIISLGKPKGIGAKSYNQLLEIVKGEDIVSDKIAFQSNFPVYIQNFLKSVDVQNNHELFEFLRNKDLNRRFINRKKTIQVLKEYLVKEMTKQ
jgi:hypothetical protein